VILTFSHVVQGANSFVDILQHRAKQMPDQLAYQFLVDGEDEVVQLTYAELDRKARAIGALLQAQCQPGDRAVLLYAPGLDYVAAYLGCLYGGMVAVPAYPPDPMRLNRTLPRLQAIVNDAQAAIVLTTAGIRDMAEMLFAVAEDLSKLTWRSTDDLDPVHAESWSDPEARPEQLAFLQYTSGSTADPKGVMITHGNLLHNSKHIYRLFGHSPGSRGVIWLPTYHDMGLIGGVLQPLYAGFPVVLMSPIAFLQRPIRWLKAVSKHRATTSGGPNFAYELCVRKIKPEERVGLDLSSWQVAFNGAEPIRPDALDRFAAAFAANGFRREAFFPCYGLAEGTLISSGGKVSEPPFVTAVSGAALEGNQVELTSPGAPDGRSVVGCGVALDDQELVIAEPESCTRAAAAQVGEIWLKGGSVAVGYWNRKHETEAAFGAYLASGEGPYLRTGDLGFVDPSGELYVTGRSKDLIILAGRNHYPHDIEHTVEKAHASIRTGCTAAFSVELDGEEKLVVVAEVERRLTKPRSETGTAPDGSDRRIDKVDPGNDPDRLVVFDPKEVVKVLRRAISDQHRLGLHDVVLLKPGSIPKTSSGKIQRHACRNGYLAKNLDSV
jgi:acyl-CoA synthetase (AMP-forming)/AMP-acid ligase II